MSEVQVIKANSPYTLRPELFVKTILMKNTDAVGCVTFTLDCITCVLFRNPAHSCVLFVKEKKKKHYYAEEATTVV